MELILCRALRVYFIHDLFQRSSWEEEVGLSGDSLPAKSQIRLFSLHVLPREPIPKGRKDYWSFSRKCQCFSIGNPSIGAERNRILY